MMLRSEPFLKLVGELVKRMGERPRTGTATGFRSPEIEKKVQSYVSFKQVWSVADEDILALIAMAEIMREKYVDPVREKNEDQLQAHYGVNAFSRLATATALARIKEARQGFSGVKKQCEAIRALAPALAARAVLGGPMNASMITINKLAADRAVDVCRTNERYIDGILTKLDAIIKMNESILA